MNWWRLITTRELTLIISSKCSSIIERMVVIGSVLEVKRHIFGANVVYHTYLFVFLCLIAVFVCCWLGGLFVLFDVIAEHHARVEPIALLRRRVDLLISYLEYAGRFVMSLWVWITVHECWVKGLVRVLQIRLYAWWLLIMENMRCVLY